jgi:hypothetical protein
LKQKFKQVTEENVMPANEDKIAEAPKERS